MRQEKTTTAAGEKKKRKKALQFKQSQYLRLVMEGRLSTDEILAKLGVTLRAFTSWMRDPLFVTRYKLVVEGTELRERADAAALGLTENRVIRRGFQGLPCAAVEEEGDGRGKGADGRLRMEDGGGEVVSEREAIRRRHGEEAARAFDRLVERRERGERGTEARRHEGTEGGIEEGTEARRHEGTEGVGEGSEVGGQGSEVEEGEGGGHE